MSPHPSDPLLASLLAAVEAAPDDVPLRLHVAELLLGCGRGAGPLQHCSPALAVAPGAPAAIALLQRVTATLAGPPASPSTPPSSPPSTDEPTARLAPKGAAPRRGRQPEPHQPESPQFDWRRAEEQLSDLP